MIKKYQRDLPEKNIDKMTLKEIYAAERKGGATQEHANFVVDVIKHNRYI